MRHWVYTVDAFTTQRFKGNPAAVLLSKKELPTSLMQEIAGEFNLSETAFPVPLSDKDFDSARVFNLRFFSPMVEVPLCGHATLSTAHVLFNELGNWHTSLEFHTPGGLVSVRKHKKGVELNFPAHPVQIAQLEGVDNVASGLFEEFEPLTNLKELVQGMLPSDISIRSVALTPANHFLIVEIDSAITKENFLSIAPDTEAMVRLLPGGEVIRGVIVTFAPEDPVKQGFVDEHGAPYDYVSRMFAPWIGIKEDPATGASHCSLGPYWSKILDKKQFYAYQCYPGRGAQFTVTMERGKGEERVAILGSSVTMVKGEIELGN